MPPTGEKVTIYVKAVYGITKKEGVLLHADKHGVTFIPKRARKPAHIMSYYDPFWMVVKGHGHPDPDAAFGAEEPTETPGVSIKKGKYRGQDPRWVDDLMAGAAKGLKPLCMYKDGTFTNPGNVPAPPERKNAWESIRPELEDLRSLL